MKMDKTKKTFIGLGILGAAFIANAVFNLILSIREDIILYKIPEYKTYSEKVIQLKKKETYHKRLISGLEGYLNGDVRIYYRNQDIIIPKSKAIEDIFAMEKRKAIKEMNGINEEIQSLEDEILQNHEIKRHEERIDTYENRAINPFYSGSKK